MGLQKGEKFLWDGAKIALLISKYEADDSIISIATALHINREMAAKKIRDLNLPRRDWVHEEDAAPSEYMLQKYVRHQEVRNAVLASLVPRPDVPVHEPLGHTEGCSYVVNDDRPALYCDGPVARGKSYCAEHSAVVFRDPHPWEESVLKWGLKHA
jgi:hypothetical protein